VSQSTLKHHKDSTSMHVSKSQRTCTRRMCYNVAFGLPRALFRTRNEVD
jgi:hypothetical protein